MCEKEFSFTHHQRSTNQNHNKLTPGGWRCLLPKCTNCWQGEGEKDRLLHCWEQRKSVQTLGETVWRFLSNILQVEVPSHPGGGFLCVYLKNTKITGICTPMLTA